MNLKDIIIEPIITEKTTNLVKDDHYAFKVNLRARKTQIKQAIEQLYQVKVKIVRTFIRKGKKIRVGKNRLKQKSQSPEKIAFVKLEEGKIEVFPKT
ncbi:MAG: 50S ribosomal protein L23 [Patescibacteria group bacterium]|nr:50S ribosomal protein L23 [Patescibacteria group bacterium]